MFKSLSLAERGVALVVGVVISPFLLLIAGITAVLSKRTPIVAHRRVGRYGNAFWMMKFRSMWDGDRGESRGQARGFIERLPESIVPEVKNGSDPRVTSRFARFCRKHSIDELPQLWHVVRGEMSLVGPRPVTAMEWERYYGECSAEVLELRPGLTGLWQIRGRNKLTYRQRRRLDVFLARHYCLLLYLRILGNTMPRVIAGRDAW